MNFYAVIILAAIILDFLVQLTADYLNLRYLEGEPPAALSDVVDADTYRRSQAYTRTNTRFGILTASFSLALTLAFWFAGGFNRLDIFIRHWQLHPIWNGLIYIALLMLLRFVVMLPFSVYDTFIIEERFGFNRTTVRTFILDIFKGLALSILLGGPLLAGVLALFQYAGSLAWLWCWLAVSLVTVFLQFVAPVWILPLFNKFTPLEEGELRQGIMEYCRKVDYYISGLFVMDGSRRSAKSNAFFTGFGRSRRIALYDTLMGNHSPDQIVAILAHEIGHYKKHHITRSIIIGIIHSGVLFFLLSLFLTVRGLHTAFFMDHINIYTGLVFFGLLYTPVEMILSLLFHHLSRRREYEADRFAALTTGAPEALSAALKRLSLDNLSNLRPHPFYVFLNYSHPPLLKRLERLGVAETHTRRERNHAV